MSDNMSPSPSPLPTFLGIGIRFSIHFVFLVLSVDPTLVNSAVPGSTSFSRDLNQQSNSTPMIIVPFIVGGVECTRNELPYQVSVRVSGNHFCGGVILNQDYVLTAAHCARQHSTSYLTVAGGEHRLDQNDGTEQIIPVDRAISHPSYSTYPTLRNDIALLRLRYSFSFNNAVQPIALAPDGSTATGNATVSGWGAIQQGGSLSPVLRRVTVPIISDTECRIRYYPYYPIENSMICAGRAGRDACQGDSGGPLVSSSSRYLVGLVSWGIGCGHATYPGVYTEISHFRGWISQNSKGIENTTLISDHDLGQNTL